MTSIVAWVIGIGVSLAALVVAAAQQQVYVHMALAAAVSIAVAIASVIESRAADASSGAPAASEGSVASSLQHMGFVWAWGALGLLVTYAFGILSWREWWQFLIAFALLAALSLYLATSLRNDTRSNGADPMPTKVARGFSLFILIAMLITMIGLLFDGKMWRFTTQAGMRPGSQDWAANNFFFFGALALAIISANTVRLTGRKLAKAAA